MVAKYGENDYDVLVQADPEEEGTYLMTVPGLPYSQIQDGESLTLTFTMGEYTVEKNVKKPKVLDVIAYLNSRSLT